MTRCYFDCGRDHSEDGPHRKRQLSVFRLSTSRLPWSRQRNSHWEEHSPRGPGSTTFERHFSDLKAPESVSQ